ncbi:MAG: heparinase II/III family protein [Armatimonadota bacterium]|nr:heparinase II/III family protein [Armatimonadota bacterium]
MLRRTLVIICCLALFAGVSTFAGPVLDEVLNYMFLDQTTTLTPRDELFPVQHTINLNKESPVGQTFVTGPETERIIRIRGWIAPDADWQPGEGAEMTLWDSPEKKTCLGKYTIWYEYRGFQYERPEWEINARVQPNTQYYFEISYAGKGDGKLSRVGARNGADDYKSGQGYLAGEEADFDLCFQTHVKKPMDRIGNLKKAFARFDLAHPELSEVKEAVDREDFETAMARLVNHFETRKTWPIMDPTIAPKINPSFDTKESDLAMQNYFSSQEMGNGYAGPDINWRGEPDFNPNGTIAASGWNTGINRFGPRGPLTKGYLATGNEKYIRKLNNVLIDWYLDNPPPGISKVGGAGSDPVWATLDCGIRLAANWVAWERMHTSPNFTLDGRMAYILNLGDDADTLVLNGAGDGGNWGFLSNSALFDFGLKNPEYANAPKWRDAAVERLAIGIKRDILPDGVENEAAPGYQRMSYGPLADIYRLIQETKVQMPFAGEMKGIMERQAEYFMYLAMPNGITPFLGDWGNTHERDALKGDSEMLHRKDFLYVATAGKEGTKPRELSKLYPYTGIVTMRSDWGDADRPYEDGRYLMLHGVRHGSHGHADLNAITCYAYGRELLADPGSYIYGSPEHDLLTKTQSHNLLMIDGEQQIWRTGAEFGNWSTTPVADYLSSRVTSSKAGEHNREVYYIRANGDPETRDYWIVRDTALGSGSHSLEQRWHFVPGPAALAPDTLEFRTGYDQGGNLNIVQVEPSRFKAVQSETSTWMPRGATGDPQKMPTAVYTLTTELPAAIDTLLFPFEGRQEAVKPLLLEKSPNGMDSAFKMVQGQTEDIFIFQKAAGPKSLQSQKIAFDGERLFVRRVGGKVRSLLLVNGTSVSVSGKQIVRSAKPVSWVAVSFDPAGVKAYCSSAEPTLVVSGAKGKKAKVMALNTDELIRLRAK